MSLLPQDPTFGLNQDTSFEECKQVFINASDFLLSFGAWQQLESGTPDARTAKRAIYNILQTVFFVAGSPRMARHAEAVDKIDKIITLMGLDDAALGAAFDPNVQPFFSDAAAAVRADKTARLSGLVMRIANDWVALLTKVCSERRISRFGHAVGPDGDIDVSRIAGRTGASDVLELIEVMFFTRGSDVGPMTFQEAEAKTELKRSFVKTLDFLIDLDVFTLPLTGNDQDSGFGGIVYTIRGEDNLSKMYRELMKRLKSTRTYCTAEVLKEALTGETILKMVGVLAAMVLVRSSTQKHHPLPLVWVMALVMRRAKTEVERIANLANATQYELNQSDLRAFAEFPKAGFPWRTRWAETGAATPATEPKRIRVDDELEPQSPTGTARRLDMSQDWVTIAKPFVYDGDSTHFPPGPRPQCPVRDCTKGGGSHWGFCSRMPQQLIEEIRRGIEATKKKK